MAASPQIAVSSSLLLCSRPNDTLQTRLGHIPDYDYSPGQPPKNRMGLVRYPCRGCRLHELRKASICRCHSRYFCRGFHQTAYVWRSYLSDGRRPGYGHTRPHQPREASRIKYNIPSLSIIVSHFLSLLIYGRSRRLESPVASDILIIRCPSLLLVVSRFAPSIYLISNLLRTITKAADIDSLTACSPL